MARAAARRRLPPEVIPLQAPQYPLPLPHEGARTGTRLPPPLPCERERRADLHSLTHTLTPLERALTLWLQRCLHTAGAEAMVRQHGARAVLNALRDGVVHREYDRAKGYYVYKPHAKLRNPGGFLRWLLEGGRP